MPNQKKQNDERNIYIIYFWSKEMTSQFDSMLENDITCIWLINNQVGFFSSLDMFSILWLMRDCCSLIS